MAAVCTCEGWQATVVPGPPGGGREVVVSGRCTCPRAGYGLVLAPAAAQPEPGCLVLELTVDEPEMAATVVTTSEVVWRGPLAPSVVEVELRVPAGGRDGPVRVPVTDG